MSQHGVSRVRQHGDTVWTQVKHITRNCLTLVMLSCTLSSAPLLFQQFLFNCNCFSRLSMFTIGRSPVYLCFTVTETRTVQVRFSPLQFFRCDLELEIWLKPQPATNLYDWDMYKNSPTCGHEQVQEDTWIVWPSTSFSFGYLNLCWFFRSRRGPRRTRQ